MNVGFLVGCEKIDVKHVMNAPLCGKFQSIIDRGHHLDDPEGAMSFGHKLSGWLIGTQVASFQPYKVSFGVSLCLTHDFCALTISSWACCLALLNWSSLSATCGMGDGLSVQSSCGLNPYSTTKGDSLVVSFGQLLCVNSASGRYACQLSWRSLTQNRKYCSNH